MMLSNSKNNSNNQNNSTIYCNQQQQQHQPKQQQQFILSSSLSSLFSLALAAPSLQERRHVVRSVSVPHGFSYLQKASQEHTLTLRIALVQSNATGLEKALYDVSNPASENYGHHLTKAEVCASFLDAF